MTKVFNKKSEEKEKRRKLRNNQTYTEKVLWHSLRRRQICGVRFLRQYSVNYFVIDFYAPKIKLAIEVDGSSHIGREEYDKQREKHIAQYGIEFIRFTNEEVMGNVNKVVDRIGEVVRAKLLLAGVNTNPS